MPVPVFYTLKDVPRGMIGVVLSKGSATLPVVISRLSVIFVEPSSMISPSLILNVPERSYDLQLSFPISAKACPMVPPAEMKLCFVAMFSCT